MNINSPILRRRLLLGALSLPLLAAGSAKLAGVPELHASFQALGLPAWFGYFIGACEVAGALGLWIAPLRKLAATGLIGIMLGALYFHLRFTPLSQGIPAAVLLGLSLLAWRLPREPQA